MAERSSSQYDGHGPCLSAAGPYTGWRAPRAGDRRLSALDAGIGAAREQGRMHRSVVETVIGAVVLAVAGLFLYFPYWTGYQRVEGYNVTAKFNRVDGLGVGSDVRLSGITVGRVVATQLDPATY